MAHQITVSELTDKMANDMALRDPRIDAWLTETDNEYISLQIANSVFGMTLRTPMHPLIKRYLVCYCSMAIFRDNTGAGGPDSMDTDIYAAKYRQYFELLNGFRAEITRPLFLFEDTALQAKDTVKSVVIWPG